MWPVQLLVGLVCGVIAASIASHKGRSVVGWFFAGFFIGLIGIVIVACLANLNEEKARRMRTDSERHRLREQLRQERLKNEAFRQYSMQRLDAHDRTLGVDTRSPAALPGGETESALRYLADGGQPPPAAAGEAGSGWYYEIDGQPKGPVSELQIRRMLREKHIGGHTLLWTEGFGDWTLANQIEKFRSEVSS